MTTPAAWATVQDVLDFTNVVVTDEELSMAIGTIEDACGRLTIDSTRIGARDLHWLRKAVSYQAAWLQANPDVFQRIEITADGSASSSTQYAPEALVLAPFAARALKRVSWLRSRGLQVRSVDEIDPDDDQTFPGEEDLTWRPVEM